MNTQMLGRQLGLSEIIPVNKQEAHIHNVQVFDFFIVLDFEATCWRPQDCDKGMPEIIEFPAVFYSVQQQKILTEFQQYVMPMEHPKLSEFCTNFTGITQNQVERGVPLQTSLMLFSKWVQELTNKYELTFDVSCIDRRKKTCALMTWSDWDLKVCLYNECRRKNIIKPTIFNKWIDLRALYKEFFNKKPKGLKYVLEEMGLSFVGTEHCGLHDARNTAFLAGKMVATGVLLRITTII